MRQRRRWLAMLIAIIMVLSAGNVSLTTAYAVNTADSTYTTYTYDDVTFLKSIGNESAEGTDKNCTSMQGMVATEDYLYVAKVNSGNVYSIIVQYDVENGTTKTLKYYPSLDPDATAAGLDAAGHCNDMTTYTYNGNKYMVTASTYHPTSSPSFFCLTSFLLDEENAALRFTGYYNLTRANNAGETVVRFLP